MLFEFDDDQRLWQKSVRDVVAKECPPTLVRAVCDADGDPTPLWHTYADLGWTELTDAAQMVELAIVLEELGRATDPTPYLATLTQFAPLVPDGLVGSRETGAAVVEGVRARREGRGWVLDGAARHVLDGDRADWFAVVTEGSGVFVVPAAAASAVRTPVIDPLLHIADVTFPAVRVAEDARVSAEPAPAAGDIALTGLAVTMVGACRRVLDLVLEHTRTREQFGVAIGTFQAVQHKAADLHVAIERARVLAFHAALNIAADDPGRALSAAMAKAAAGECQALVFRHGIQLFGAMGFTWENDLQFALKRAKAGELLLGGAAQHRARIGDLITAPSGTVPPINATRGGVTTDVQLTFDAEVEEFRAEFAAFLDAHLPTEAEATERSRSTADVPAWARRWQRLLFDEGWLLPGKPPELGGRNASLLQQYVHLEELSKRRVYHSFNPQGLGIIAASLLTFGTDEQKRRWAVPILRAEQTAALGMSEPGAGSDLASLRTRAELAADGSHFVVNGQKVWTSGAHDADLLLTFVRTDPDAPKHRGISCLVIPTDTPGMSRRPFGSLTAPDDLDFNEVYFDDVHVPAENLIGPLNEGWRVANGSLGHERTLLWLSFADRMRELLRDFRPSTDLDRDWYATLAMDARALRLLGSQALARSARGEQDVPALSVLKLLGSEAVQKAAERALEAAGPEGLAHPATTAAYAHMEWEDFTGSWFQRYARTFAGTIAGGTSEIQRTIVAERVLGLPRP